VTSPNKDFKLPAGLELERVCGMLEAEKLTSLSRESLKRHYGDKVLRLAPRREGMKLRDVLAIANGEA
jgi:hypothetical protein